MVSKQGQPHVSGAQGAGVLQRCLHLKCGQWSNQVAAAVQVVPNVEVGKDILL